MGNRAKGQTEFRTPTISGQEPSSGEVHTVFCAWSCLRCQGSIDISRIEKAATHAHTHTAHVRTHTHYIYTHTTHTRTRVRDPTRAPRPPRAAARCEAETVCVFDERSECVPCAGVCVCVMRVCVCAPPPRPVCPPPRYRDRDICSVQTPSGLWGVLSGLTS